MKLEFINPFIDAVNNLFSTMLASSVKKGNIGVSKESRAPFAITALIGLSGEYRGTVTLSFPEDTALKMVNKMLMLDSKEVDATVIDGVGELVNIVAGSAKSKLIKKDGKPLDLSLPNVVKGEDYIIEFPSESTWIEVPFESELGNFQMRIIFENI